MIVEDYDDTRLMLKTHLEIIGFRVFGAADGNEAVAGCCDLVTKPIDFEHLEKVIERCLSEK